MGLPLDEIQGTATDLGVRTGPALATEIPDGIQETPEVRNEAQSGAGEKTACGKMPRLLLLKRSKFHAGGEKKPNDHGAGGLRESVGGDEASRNLSPPGNGDWATVVLCRARAGEAGVGLSWGR